MPRDISTVACWAASLAERTDTRRRLPAVTATDVHAFTVPVLPDARAEDPPSKSRLLLLPGDFLGGG